jgi:hypothetical protein
MKRIEFIKRTAIVATLGLPLLTVLTSCSSEADPGPAPPSTDPKDCLANGTSSSIGSNHGHSITVSKTDVENGVEKTYAILGGASHNHDVVITAANFSSLKSNNSIQVTSASGDGHTHSVSVSCA